MKKFLLLFTSIVCVIIAFEVKAQNTFRVFDTEMFIDGYADGNLAKFQDSLPPNTGVVRLRTSLVTKKITENQLSLVGNTLSMKVLIKASCDNYDRGGHVNLAFVPKGDSTYKPDSVKRIEIARFITPFMNKNKKPDTVPYNYEINNIASLLNEKSIRDSFDIWCELEIFGVPYAAHNEVAGCANRVDVCFGTIDFISNTTATIQSNNIFLALSNQINFNNYSANATDIIGQTVKTISFTLPSKSYGTKMYLITSNHGAGSGGEEYNRRNHFVYIDGSLVLEYLPGFETCEPYRKYNTQANGIYGSAPRTNEQWQSFSNWCPGAFIPTRVIHLGTLEAGPHSFKIEVPDAQFVGNDGNFPLSVYIQGKTTSVTSLNEQQKGLPEIVLYPNPSNDMIGVFVSDNIKQITIYNSLGKVLWRGNSSKIDISTIESGIYYLHIELENGHHTIRSFVKN